MAEEGCIWGVVDVHHLDGDMEEVGVSGGEEDVSGIELRNRDYVRRIGHTRKVRIVLP
jgi:hypothetical protein